MKGLRQAAAVVGSTLVTMGSIDAKALKEYTASNLDGLQTEVTAEITEVVSKATPADFSYLAISETFATEITPEEKKIAKTMLNDINTLINTVMANGLPSKERHAQMRNFIDSKKDILNNAIIDYMKTELIKQEQINTGISDAADKRAANHQGRLNKDAQEAERRDRAAEEKYRNMATLCKAARARLGKIQDQTNLESNITGISTIENKSAEVIAWEKKHQMEITEKKEWRSIVILQNGNTEPVSNIVSKSRIRGIPTVSVSGEKLVFTYTDAEKENNIIEYYLENNKLMEKTETSGTSALFEVSLQ